jgi:hypothetical protein
MGVCATPSHFEDEIQIVNILRINRSFFIWNLIICKTIKFPGKCIILFNRRGRKGFRKGRKEIYDFYNSFALFDFLSTETLSDVDFAFFAVNSSIFLILLIQERYEFTIFHSTKAH